MTDLVAIDIGGTHARFAIATLDGEGRITLGDVVTLPTARYASFQASWEAFGAIRAGEGGGLLPRAAALAVAAPVGDGANVDRIICFTNNPWIIQPALLPSQLGVDALTIVNDFGAVGHALIHALPEHFIHLAGPDVPLPGLGIISVVGPGTGLGVAHVWRDGRSLAEGGFWHVQATEGGHHDFAPLDVIDDALLARLRARYTRVSVERVVSGPGIVEIYETLAALEGRAVIAPDDKTLWRHATSGQDSLAVAAAARFCQSLGAVAGDIALVQGACGVVIAGGLGLRIRDQLLASAFADRFCAKGRFAGFMATLPVKLITHPQPGLLGAAAAFLAEHCRTGALPK